jgi:uncharacterized protein YkwD
MKTPSLLVALLALSLLAACGKKDDGPVLSGGTVTDGQDDRVPEQPGNEGRDNIRMIRAAIRMANDIRAQNRLPPLRFDFRLAQAAQAHAREMREFGFLAHQSRNGRRMQARLRDFNVPFSKAGENLAQNAGDVQELFRSWMSSPEHRRNLLNPNFRRHGIGFSGGYWTHDFAD